MKYTTMLAATVALTFCAGAPRAEDFNFTFLNATGAVSGTIYGLVNDATSLPTDIKADFDGGEVDFPTSITLGTPGFTVTDGVVTAADYFDEFPNSENAIGFNDNGDNGVVDDTFSYGDETGFSGISFTPAISAAPEPRAGSLMIAGAAAAGVAQRIGRRRRRVASLFAG